MFTAQKTRKKNIAEYILYLWQLEDLLRALQFSPEAIYSQLVQPFGQLNLKTGDFFMVYGYCQSATRRGEGATGTS